MIAQEERLLQLVDELEAKLKELRQTLGEEPNGQRTPAHKAIEAFADEALRARDA